MYYIMAAEYILNCHDIESVIVSFMLPHEMANLALLDKQHYTKYQKYYKFYKYKCFRDNDNNNKRGTIDDDVVCACDYNDDEILIKYLHYHKINIMTPTNYIMNLIDRACMNDNIFMIQYIAKIDFYMYGELRNSWVSRELYIQSGRDHIFQYACMYGAFNIFSYIMQYEPDIRAHNDRAFRRACYNKCSKIYNKLIELGCSFNVVPIYKLDKCDDFVISKVIALDHNEDDIIRAFYKFVVIKSTKLVNLLLKHFEISDIVLRECIQMAIGCDDKEMIELLQ